MLWGKGRKDPKIGDISPKDHTVVNRQFVAGVAVTLIICIALLMSGGVSQAVGKTLPGDLTLLDIKEPEFLKRAGPEILEITEVEYIKVIKPEFMKVTKFEFMEVSEIEYLESWVDPSDGLIKLGGKQKSVEYLMCAPLKGFPTPEKCLFEGR